MPESVEDIYEEIREDPLFAHLRLPSIRLVPGVGSTSSVFFLVGEAPGATENVKGRPFCGAAGKILSQFMEYCSISIVDTEDGPANAWITNVVKYRPPGNRAPTDDEIAASRDYLRREWRAVGRPKVIVLLGSTAKRAMYPNLGPLGRVAGMPFAGTGETYVWPMYHPIAGAYNKALRPAMEEHWERLAVWIANGGS